MSIDSNLLKRLSQFIEGRPDSQVIISAFEKQDSYLLTHNDEVSILSLFSVCYSPVVIYRNCC